jgi:hypothetical protein
MGIDGRTAILTFIFVGFPIMMIFRFPGSSINRFLERHLLKLMLNRKEKNVSIEKGGWS